MNRKERRKNKIKEKDPVLCIKSTELEQKMQESYENAFYIVLGLSCKVLHDQHGWRSRKRIPEFIKAVLAEYDKSSVEDLECFVYANIAPRTSTNTTKNIN